MNNFLEGLNEQQLPVAQKITGKFYVNAGAGSGKTHLITSRTGYMISQGVDPSKILMFTFTRKAANEMKERMINKIGPEAKKVTICTYHSFCSTLLRRFAHLIGYQRTFTIWDQDQKEKALSDIVKNNKKLLDIAKTMISNWKSLGLTSEDAMNNQEIRRDYYTVAQVYVKYEAVLRKNNAMDFDDLHMWGQKLVHTNEEVRHYVHTKYEYFVVKISLTTCLVISR